MFFNIYAFKSPTFPPTLPLKALPSKKRSEDVSFPVSLGAPQIVSDAFWA